MTNTTHTPGPWNIDGHSDFLDVAYSSGRICMVECEDDQQTREETEANARLIAAAPDLLKALESAQAWIARAGYTDRDKWQSVQEQARAAIAKAKGEQDYD